MKERPGSAARRALARFAPAAVIALAAWWVYSPSFDGSWIWDDAAEVAQNPLLRSADGLRKIWSGAQGPDYYPLKSTVQWGQWHLWGAHPLGYHLTNVALHLLSALLLWRLLGRLGVRLAWIGGLLWVVHPLAVESVAWISELKNALSLPLLLGAMIAYVEFDDGRAGGARWPQRVGPANDVPQRVGDNALHLCSVGLFLAGMLCKSSVAMFPAVLLLHAWWRRGRIARADLRAAAPFFLISAVLGLVTIGFQQHRAIAGVDLALGGTLSRVALAGRAIGFYFCQAVCPWGLLPIYPRWKADPPSVLQFFPWLALGLGLAWLWTRRGSPAGRAALFGVGAFLINLAPVLGFVPMAYLRISWVADHLAYVPLVSLVGLMAASFPNGKAVRRSPAGEGGPDVAGTSGKHHAAATVLVVLLAATWATEARRYAGIFRDEQTFWTYELQRNPQAWVAHNELGRALLLEGRVAEARAQFEQALRLDPADAQAQFNLGLALERSGRGAEALGRYVEALRLQPGLAAAQASLGAALLRAGRLPEAEARLRAAARLQPGDAEIRANLGAALAASGRLPEAAAELAEALRLRPEYPEADYNLGNVLAREGRSDEAIGCYEGALRLRPDDAPARVNLGIVLAGAGRWTQARLQFEAALRLRPDDPPTVENLARVRALEAAAAGRP